MCCTVPKNPIVPNRMMQNVLYCPKKPNCTQSDDAECAVLSKKHKNRMFTRIHLHRRLGLLITVNIVFLGLLGQYSTFCTTTLGTIRFFGTVQHILYHRRERVVLSPKQCLHACTTIRRWVGEWRAALDVSRIASVCRARCIKFLGEP